MLGMVFTGKYGVRTNCLRMDANWRNAASSSNSRQIPRRHYSSGHLPNRSLHSPGAHHNQAVGKILSHLRAQGKRAATAISLRNDLETGAPAVVQLSTISVEATSKARLLVV
jgi:hypothetical protein